MRDGNIMNCSCRDMLSDATRPAEDGLPLREDATTLRLLIQGMYDANMAVTDANLELLLQLADKYGVVYMRLNCARYLDSVDPCLENLPRVMRIACAHGLAPLLARCQAIAADGNNFVELERCVAVDAKSMN